MSEAVGGVDVTVTGPSGWTMEAYVAHNEAMRGEWERFTNERDRRYTEVALEREKALRIKEKADENALRLAREIQTYKDEKANELREQISSERGHYASKDDLVAAVEKLEETLKPLQDFVTSQGGRRGGTLDSRNLLFAVIAAAGVIAALAIAIVKPG